MLAPARPPVVSTPPLCATCTAPLRLYRIGPIVGQLCPHCDREHATELERLLGQN